MPEKNRKGKRNTSFRLSERCRRLIVALSDSIGVAQSAIIEMAVRDMAKAEHIDVDDEAPLTPAHNTSALPPAAAPTA